MTLNSLQPKINIHSTGTLQPLQKCL